MLGAFGDAAVVLAPLSAVSPMVWLILWFTLIVFLFAFGLQVFKNPISPARIVLWGAILLLNVSLLGLLVSQFGYKLESDALVRTGSSAALGALPPLDFWWILGILLGIFLTVAIFLGAAYFLGWSTYGIHGTTDRLATVCAMYDLLGLSKGECTVNNGAVQYSGPYAKSLETVGGPGRLTVQEGHKVITEKRGKKARVLSPGMWQLGQYERVGMIVPLGPQMERISVKNLMTKDQVRVDELNLLVFHKLMDSSDKYLLENVWNPAGATWNGAVRSISENTTRDVVGQYDFDRICPLSKDDRNGFKSLLLDEIKRTAVKASADVSGLDVGEICVPDAATKTLLERQIERWKVQIAELQGEQQQFLEAARAQAQGAMITEISDKLNRIDLERLSALQMMRLIEALEKLVENPGGNAVLLTELLRLLDQANISAPRGAPAAGTPASGATT